MTGTDESVLLAESDRLQAEYDVALAEFNATRGEARVSAEGQAAARRWDAAQLALHNGRKHWRAIGEAAPTDHPGHRPAAIKVVPDEAPAGVEVDG